MTNLHMHHVSQQYFAALIALASGVLRQNGVFNVLQVTLFLCNVKLFCNLPASFLLHCALSSLIIYGIKCMMQFSVACPAPFTESFGYVGVPKSRKPEMHLHNTFISILYFT